MLLLEEIVVGTNEKWKIYEIQGQNAKNRGV